MARMGEAETDHSLQLRTGRSIPILGLGTSPMRGREAYDAIRFALEAGYRLIDTATSYRNQEEVGRAIRDSGLAREEIFITTKVPGENAGRERPTLEDSLAQLGMDHVDLWLIHSPPGGSPGVEMWRALLQLREEGKARDVGVSNYSPVQVEALIDATGEAPVVNQIRWSPALYDGARLQHSRQHDVVLEGYSPLNASDLADPVIGEVAAAHGATPAQVILRWHVDTGVVTIPKSARPERLRENLDVFGFRLSPEEVGRLNGLGA
jgi:2,5-diketo-D-gluconate reductase A